MAMKIILIAGEPATGKTTLVREAYSPQNMPNHFKYGKLQGHTDGQIFVGGIYDGSMFEGTDKLSMAVQPDVVKFVQASISGTCNLVLIMEGDRVANPKFLSAMKDFQVQTHLIILRAPEHELEMRHLTRGDAQTPGWLKSRRTKVENLCETTRQLPHVTLHEWENHTRHSTETHVGALRAIAGL